MSLWHLVVREIKHRKLNFLLGLLSVAMAVGCLVGAQTLLTADQVITWRMLGEKQAEVESSIAETEAEVENSVAEREAAVKQAGKELEDSVRKQMLGLGFNLLILPQDQSLSEIHLDGTMTATMPESNVDKLAESKILTINHLLPSVTKRIHWDEQDQDIIVVGTRGEVPFLHRGMKKPLLDEVAPGKMVMGHELATQLGLKAGDKVTLKEKEFTISKVHDERGSTDDVTVWINLAAAQEMLGMQNLINAILALECGCESGLITQVREDVAEVLPGTQVIERYSQAVTRAESRAKAKVVAEESLAQAKKHGELTLARAKKNGEEQLALEKKSRDELEGRHADFAAVLVPLVVLGSIVMIALLAFANSRQRIEEVGILRAIGVTSRQLMLVFLSKAAAIGLLGGVVGVFAGLAFGYFAGNPASGGADWSDLFAAGNLLTIIVTAPLLALALSGLASWIPALLAARQDPAMILQGE
jgi:ABC-type lipoprotein release transport system permease subunit